MARDLLDDYPSIGYLEVIMKIPHLMPTALAAALVTLPVFVAADDSFQGSTKDAWITGKIETVYTLNRHLNPFAIDTDVESGIVRLTGVVKSDIDRDLAGELAKGIEGVVEVRNDLQVDPEGARAAREEQIGESRDFGTWVDDATTTAAVKSKLLGNGNVAGLKIDVDTKGDVVTLSGRTETAEQSELAEELARNTGDVKDVHNNLVVVR
jgi:osmotically-inducible protein OsmY